jgi:cation diffusion facilitator CzcD-associated flavoprotein CzcO
MNTRYDVLIVGAGLSGIGMACHLAMQCPDKHVGILERRSAIGGTWDLFRYPGIRSDSDMFSYGYEFRPWNDTKLLADGSSIRQYVTETAIEYGIDKKICFGIQIVRACWSSIERCWTIHTLDEQGGAGQTFFCRFLITCTGYFNYDSGYLPHFPGVEKFRGQCVHPQHWPQTLDYRGKRVVVIGSGATAVTLVPAMAGETAHITMLQRSPSYMISVPAHDQLSAILVRILPKRWIFAMARRRNIFIQRTLYKAAKRWPDRMRTLLLSGVRRRLGKGYDMRHFTPDYKPWDERLCVVPSSDLFKVLREGNASVVTDQIESFTEKGVLLKSGRELEADIVVTATGLQLQSLGGIELQVDGQIQHPNRGMTYKGMLLEGIPNLANVFGYINASWTLKADISAEYVCRLFRYMDAHGVDVVTARAPAGEMLDESVMGSLRSGYVQRSHDVLPRQGRDHPWRVTHNYEEDRRMLLSEPIEDSALEFLPEQSPFTHRDTESDAKADSELAIRT